MAKASHQNSAARRTKSTKKKILIEQAGTVPFRRENSKIEFCLITSSRKGRWGFPKGGIDPGESPEGAALKEACEEAGIEGIILGESFGRYEFRKWNISYCVDLFLMQVHNSLDDWDEAHFRERLWLRPSEVRKLLCRKELAEMFEIALDELERLEF